MLAIIMFLTFVDVVLRYVFNRPIVGSYELISYMMAILVAFGLAYCAVKKGHVTVDLLITHLPLPAKGIFESIIYFLSLVFFSLVTWQSALYVKETFNLKLISAVLRIPAYPFVAIVVLGSAVFCLVLLVDFLNSLSKMVKK